MATTVTTAGKNIAVQALADACTHAALLNSSGVELSGGSPAYARKAISKAAASGGAVALSASPVFDIPAGAEVAKVAYYSASTGGTQYCIDDLSAVETYTGQGTYTLTSGTITIADPA